MTEGVSRVQHCFCQPAVCAVLAAPCSGCRWHSLERAPVRLICLDYKLVFSTFEIPPRQKTDRFSFLVCLSLAVVSHPRAEADSHQSRDRTLCVTGFFVWSTGAVDAKRLHLRRSGSCRTGGAQHQPRSRAGERCAPPSQSKILKSGVNQVYELFGVRRCRVVWWKSL